MLSLVFIMRANKWSIRMNFFEGEIISVEPDNNVSVSMSDKAINEKYRSGEIRIVTEQARYPLDTISSLVNGGNYNLNPEYQRRHRWDNVKRSMLIESLIMNVPIPPIFLYEYEYSSYEVMDGLQRLTAIASFYDDEFQLAGLKKWPELNGRTYSSLPELVKKGIDRRYISSIILLHETAKNEHDAEQLKQMVFDRINSGGEKLTPQEKRNANFDGKLNKKCIELSENPYLCQTWDIPLPSGDYGINSERAENKLFKTMGDVELVLRFFAFRQRGQLQKGSLENYLDFYLEKGNYFSTSLIENLANLFNETIEFAFELFGEKAFWLYRSRRNGWSWYDRATTAVYDPMMYVLSMHLEHKTKLLEQKDNISENLMDFYKGNYDLFEGRNTNPSALEGRVISLMDFVRGYI